MTGAITRNSPLPYDWARCSVNRQRPREFSGIRIKRHDSDESGFRLCARREGSHLSNQHLHRLLVLTGLLLFTSAAAATGAPRDFVILVELSDTGGDRSEATGEFIDALRERLPADARLSIITFDDRTQVLRALEPAGQAADESATRRLHGAQPAGSRHVNTAGALERAIYELRVHGRAEAGKVIVVIGNGGIDTGEPARDAGLSAWVRDDLAKESKQAGIRIFWLTTSESADYQLVQTVTHDTGGDYYRAFDRVERMDALDSLIDAVQPQEPGAADRAPPSRAAANPPRLEIAPAVLAGAAVILATILTSAILLRRGRGARGRAGETAPRPDRQRVGSRVQLRDVSGFTGQTVYDITGKRTFVGRQPREVTRSNFVIVIPDQAISRSHADIEFRDNGYWINDTSSVNGTYVNERRLGGSHLLRNGDRIRFAKFEFEFTLSPPPAGEEADGRMSGPHTTTHTENDDRTLIRPRVR